jgi:hypothetical protein
MASSNAEMDRVLAAGKTAIIHTVEGGQVLGSGLEADDLPGREVRLDELAERGAASLTLAHLSRTTWRDTPKPSPRCWRDSPFAS